MWNLMNTKLIVNYHYSYCERKMQESKFSVKLALKYCKILFTAQEKITFSEGCT